MSKTNILVIPGWMESVKVFSKVKELLSDYCNFIFIDLPGFNGEKINQTFTPKEYAKYIYAYVMQKNINFDVILSHSYGAKVAIEYYLNFKKTPLIFVAPAIVRPNKKVSVKLRVFSYKLLKKLKLLRKGKEYGSRDYINTPPCMKETFKIAISTYYDNYLSHIKDKTLLIYGKDDRVTPKKEGERILKIIDDSEMKIINGGHFCFLDSNIEFCKVIYKFLRDNLC